MLGGHLHGQYGILYLLADWVIEKGLTEVDCGSIGTDFRLDRSKLQRVHYEGIFSYLSYHAGR